MTGLPGSGRLARSDGENGPQRFKYVSLRHRQASRSRHRPRVLFVRRAFGPLPESGSVGDGGLISGPRKSSRPSVAATIRGSGRGGRRMNASMPPETAKKVRSGRGGRRVFWLQEARPERRRKRASDIQIYLLSAPTGLLGFRAPPERRRKRPSEAQIW